MRKSYQSLIPFPTFVLLALTLCIMTSAATEVKAEARGEIRIVESLRPDINVLGHNVLQYFFAVEGRFPRGNLWGIVTA